MSRKLLQRIGRVRIYRDIDTREYVVVADGSEYFTDDKQDAVDTANAILTDKQLKNPRRNPPDEKLHLAFNNILVSSKVWRQLGGNRRTRFPDTSDLGGYPLYYTVAEPHDNAKGRYHNHVIVSAKTLNDDAISADDVVVDVAINYEDDDLYDEISGDKIPSAYGENPKKPKGYGNVLQSYAVVLWHEDARYRLADVVKIFKRESDAEHYADERNEAEPRGHGGYVVRRMSSILDAKDYS
jgi:hypothetical protein